MRNLFIFCLFITTIFSQELKFVVVNNFDVSKPNASSRLTAIQRNISSNKVEFTAFNALHASSKDENFFNRLKNEKYYIPYKNEFNWVKSSRSNFLMNFGDLNFRYDSDDIFVIGLNCSVFWDDKSRLSKEELNYLKTELDDIFPSKEIILVLPDNPGNIANIDDALSLLNNHIVRLIISSVADQQVLTNFNGINVLHPKEFRKQTTVCQKISIKDDTTMVYQVFEDASSELVRTIVDPSKTFSAGNKKAFYDPNNLIIWQKNVNSSLIGDLAYEDSKIISADQSGRILCLDTLGNDVWEYFSFGNVYSTPVYKDGFVAIASIQGDLETIDAKTGNQVQSIGFDDPVSGNLATFNYNGPSSLMIPKQTNSKAAVTVGLENGSLYCYDLETLQEYWKFDTPKGKIQGTPFIQKNQVVFYSADGNIYTVDGSNGWLTWKIKVEKPFPLASDVVSNNENLFISVPNDKLYSIETLLGKINWSQSKYNTWTSLGIANKGTILFAESSDNRFHYLSAQQGTWVKEFYQKLGRQKTKTDIIEIDDSVYFGTDDGYFVRIIGRNKVEKILRLDSSPIYFIKQLPNNKLLIASRNGTVAVIRIK